MGSTKIVAWWGAILSTVVFLWTIGWEIYKYKRAGPRLRFTVRTGMVSNVPWDQSPVVLSEVTNYGDRPTTIENLAFLFYEKRRFFQKKIPIIVRLLNPSTTQPLPFTLQPGVVWIGTAIQDAQVETLASNRILYMILFHSHTSKPMRRRVVISRFARNALSRASITQRELN